MIFMRRPMMMMCCLLLIIIGVGAAGRTLEK
jgi:hypothetical protein